jgi:hypothetical protein
MDRGGEGGGIPRVMLNWEFDNSFIEQLEEPSEWGCQGGQPKVVSMGKLEGFSPFIPIPINSGLRCEVKVAMEIVNDIDNGVIN